MSKGAYALTTPIYYVNAAPHLGTAYTTIAADALARYERMNGYDVSFVTGMDEHGQKVADTAAAHDMEPQEWCDSMEPAFRDAWDMLDITYTDFVRTTEPRHAETVRKFWNDLYEKGIRVPMKVGIAFTKRLTTPNPTSRRTRRANTFAPIASVLFRRRAGKRTGSSSFPISKTSCSNSTRRTLISSAQLRVRMKLFRS